MPMQLDKQCLRCGATTNLDTSLKITVEDKTYEVSLCTTHGENTTPKQAKDLIIKKLKEYNELVEKMKSFGMDIANMQTSPGGIALPKAAPAPAPAPEAPSETPPEDAPAAPVIPSSTKVIIQKLPQTKGKTTEIIRGQVPTVRAISGVAQGARTSMRVEGRSSINVAESIDKEIQAIAPGSKIRPASKVMEEQLVRGRGGQPMRIPRVIKHTIGGNTVINVVDTGGDKLIQDRFRGLRDVIYNYGEKGYDVQNCTLCGGSGVAAATGGTCPKCQGVGFLNKGWG